MQRPLRRDLDAWSRRHAFALIAAGTASVIARSSWVLAGVAAASFVHLIVLARGRTTDRGSFGPANAVTSVRIALVLALPAIPSRLFGPAMLAVLVLDGLDGFVARRTGTSSEFGAHFDMESDGVLVAVTTLETWLRGRLGAWVLIAGVLRYAYVCCLWAFPSNRGEEPRSLVGRLAFLLVVLGVATAWLSDAAPATAAAALGCAIVTLSFARSFLHSYGPR